MQDVAQRQCKVVSDSQWSLSTFMEFYERVLSPRIFHPYGKLLAREVASDIDAGFVVRDVLEVACGTGVITASLYEDLARPRGLRLVASDLSQIAVNMARRVLSPEIQQHVPLLADVDMAELPFEDNSFDVIVCGFGLMFPPDKARVAREFRRVLRPGGRVYATMFHYNQLFELTRQQSQLHFGMPSRLMDAALSLTDPSPITRAFAIEGLSRANDLPAGLHPLSFSLDAAGAREFLFNACILLEEFNQCDTGTREHYLDLMLAQFRKDVPDQRYRVEAWLLRGQADPAHAGTTLDITPPDFSPLLRCQQLTHRASCVGAERAVPAHEAQALDAFTAARAQFLAEHPGFPDASVEKMRNEEYARLDEQHVTYLDHVGGTLPPESLLEQDLQALKHAILGNPHSGSKASQAAYQQARDTIYAFFGCSPDEYEVIFTANASSAIRLVAESFPFQPGTQLLLTKDNHTSVHGLREYARAKGALVKYIPLDDDLLLHEDLMQRALQRLGDGAPHLLAFPAQSNATGARHDLAWIARARAHGAMVLCDAAALVPQARLDCGTLQPDFVVASFYKIFGYPTGAGCLLARRSSLQLLRPPSFAGGGVCYYSGPWSPTERLLYRDAGQRFEIGTPNYAAFPAIARGFAFVARMGGVEALALRSGALARWLEARLAALRHTVRGDTPLCRVYGPPAQHKGATVMLNFFDCYGSIMPHARIKRLADRFGITLRNGCFCNLGAVQQATYATAGAEHCELDKTGKILDCTAFDEKILDKGDCGAVRISFGLGSNFADAYRFLMFATCLMDTDVSGLEGALAGSDPAVDAGSLRAAPAVPA